MKVRKLKRASKRLTGRIEGWERITKEQKSDISRKHPDGFKKPGRNY
jgi:hypothetical protein